MLQLLLHMYCCINLALHLGCLDCYRRQSYLLVWFVWPCAA